MVELIWVLLEDLLAEIGKGALLRVKVLCAGGVVLEDEISVTVCEDDEEEEVMVAGREALLCAFRGDRVSCALLAGIFLCGCAAVRHFA